LGGGGFIGDAQPIKKLSKVELTNNFPAFRIIWPPSEANPGTPKDFPPLSLFCQYKLQPWARPVGRILANEAQNVTNRTSDVRRMRDQRAEKRSRDH